MLLSTKKELVQANTGFILCGSALLRPSYSDDLSTGGNISLSMEAKLTFLLV